MSLGLRLIWRARSRMGPNLGLSSALGGARHPLLNSTLQAQARRWLSPPAREDPWVLGAVGAADSRAEGDAPLVASAQTTSTPSLAAHRKHSLRREIKARVPSQHSTPMIKRRINYPDRRASYRSLRKHNNSVLRQLRHDHAQEALNKPVTNWRLVLDFMIHHTPKHGELLDFKVGIGRGAAAQARANLSELDTNLWQIQKRHGCKIRIESGSHGNVPLILSLSGTNVSVQGSLSELIRVVGRVSAVRVLDRARQISLSEVWKGDHQDGRPIRLLGDEEPAAEDETVTLYGSTVEFASLARPPTPKPYQLTTRADEIPEPAVWTKSSFEQYVSSLVLGRVPTHLHRSLYPDGPDHQTTVVNLLTKIFRLEDMETVISVSALNMALRFIHSCGPVFRPAARALFYQSELQHLPIDAETFHGFLTSASRGSDLNGFYSILKAMHRRGHYMRAETWTAFLAMIHDPQIKQQIMKKMRSRDLHRLQLILEELGRQNTVLELEHGIGTDMAVEELIRTQDNLYGKSWLNTMTLNRMIDIIGSNGNLEACNELLQLAEHDRRARADHYTLNTMIIHTKSIPKKIALLSRWPNLEPDVVTYQQLFQTAWKQRLPNMLGVVWRYAVFAGLTNSSMRNALTKLIRAGPTSSNQQGFIKAWEDVIFGRDELATGRRLSSDDPNGFGAVQLMGQYLEDAGEKRPLVEVGAKLREAYELDMRIHKLGGEGIVTPSMMETLTVKIPLGDKGKNEAQPIQIKYS